MVGSNLMNSSFSLPDGVGQELCKALGLAISNISMYGTEHSVTAGALAAVYDDLQEKLDSYGEIEFVLGEGRNLLVNGSLVDTERTTGQLLVAQLNKLAVHDFAFRAPLDRAEFNTFMSILAAVPGSATVSAGFEAAVRNAHLKCVKVKNVSYARVDSDADLSKLNFDDCGDSPDKAKSAGLMEGLAGSGAKRVSEGSGSKVFELDMDMSLDELSFDDLGFEAPEKSADQGVPTAKPFHRPVAQSRSSVNMSSVRSYLESRRSASELRSQLAEQVRTAVTPQERSALRSQLLAAGFSEEEWGDLLLESGVAGSDISYDDRAIETLRRIQQDIEKLAAQGGTVVGGKSSAGMSSILDAIGSEVSRMMSQTGGQISRLADKVDADREVIAQVEQDARESGIGLNLSREELLESLAEINQELAQSLTVVSSVTDILCSEKIGSLTPAQKDVLEVASSGVAKINKLVSYLGNISGVPEQLTPDRALLDEAYGNS